MSECNNEKAETIIMETDKPNKEGRMYSSDLVDEAIRNMQLSDEDVEKVNKILEENVESSKDLKVLANLPSNNGVSESSSNEEGYTVDQLVTIDPETGIAKPTSSTLPESGTDMSFEDLVKQVESNSIPEKVDLTIEDIEEEVKNEEDFFKTLNLSREDMIKILTITKRVQEGEKFNIFKEFPESVKKSINGYISSAGLASESHTNQINSIRNSLSEMIINEFITNISLKKYTLDFQNEMNIIQNKVNETMSEMFADYTESRDKYITAIMENEDDESKKEAIGKILDAIHDGFALERIKEAVRNHRIKIKKFDLEKPKKPFESFLNKYHNSTQNIYSVWTAASVLYRHMKDEVTEEDVIKFFVAICKYCQNYKPENPVDHAFMYYAMYNPVLLDVYKGEQYEKFASEYKKNVLEVIDLLNNK